MKLGIDDPLAWLDTIPDKTWAMWQAYWQIEPWGTDWERHSEMMVMLDAIYAATVNPHLDKRDRHKVREAADFMPRDYDRPKRPKQSEADIVDQLNAFAGIG